MTKHFFDGEDWEFEKISKLVYSLIDYSHYNYRLRSW